jgi:putative oxidoreductase
MMLLSKTFALFRSLDLTAPVVLPTLGRLVFAGVILSYFWASALTKIGPGAFGFLTPSSGAYAQIFPRAFEAAGYDTSALGLFHWLVTVGGTLAEFILPCLIILGLMTRLAAVGMIGFIVVQSLTDIYGHLAGPDTIGAWFDRVADAQIMDQRAFWIFLLTVLVFLGAGPLSLDRLVRRALPSAN